MKAKIKEGKKEFKPFELCIQVENINDLKELWCRFNASIHEVKASNTEYPHIQDFISDYEDGVFKILDIKLGELK